MQLLSFSGSVALALTALLGVVDPAPGAALKFYFEGHITEIHDFLELDDSVFVGAPFSGSYTFDPSGVKDSFPDNPNVGFYRFAPPARMSARIGNYEFVTNDLGMLIWNDQLSGDVYEPISNGGFTAAGYQWSIMVVFLLDESGMALNSDALFLDVPVLSDFPSETSFGVFLPGNNLGIGGTLTSLTPEPASLALVTLGAIALCRRKWCLGAG